MAIFHNNFWEYKNGHEWYEALYYSHLSNEFFQEYDPQYGVYTCKIKNGEDTSSEIILKVLCVSEFNLFKNWCKPYNIQLHIKKKIIDNKKIWWPDQFEVIVPHDDEILVWLKLKYS